MADATNCYSPVHEGFTQAQPDLVSPVPGDTGENCAGTAVPVQHGEGYGCIQHPEIFGPYQSVISDPMDVDTQTQQQQRQPQHINNC